MEAELISFSGLVLMFVLGLRHGLDPDHIACIDGLTWRALTHEHPHAHWIGTLFATVFDTATQASAWGYVASNKGGGLLAAFLAGIVFTVGMVITDTLDGRLICRISRGTDGQTAGRRFRRSLGWLIVAISYGVAAYNIGKAWLPAIELDDLAFSLAGFSLIAVMCLIWAWVWHGRRQPHRASARQLR